MLVRHNAPKCFGLYFMVSCSRFREEYKFFIKTYTFHKALTFNAVNQCSFFVICILWDKFNSCINSGTFIYWDWTEILWSPPPTRAKIYITKEITPFLPFSFSNSNSCAISEKLSFHESFASSSFFKHSSLCHV